MFIPNISVTPHFEKLNIVAPRTEADEFYISIERISLPPSSEEEVAYVLLTSHGNVQLLIGEREGTKYSWKIQSFDRSDAQGSGLLKSFGRRLSAYIPNLSRADQSPAICMRTWSGDDEFGTVAVLCSKRLVLFHRSLVNPETQPVILSVPLAEMVHHIPNGLNYEPMDVSFDFPPYSQRLEESFPTLVVVLGNIESKCLAVVEIDISAQGNSLAVTDARVVNNLPQKMSYDIKNLRCLSVSSFIFLYTPSDLLVLKRNDHAFHQILPTCGSSNAILSATVFNKSIPVFLNRMTGISALLCDDLPLQPFSFPLLRRKASLLSNRQALQKAHKLSMSKEVHDKLEAAWIYFTVQDMTSCLKIVSNLASSPNRNLSFLVSQLAWSALDEKLPTDPRWKKVVDANDNIEKYTSSSFLYRTNSLLIKDQMKAKWDSFLAFCDFATSGQLLGRNNFNRHPSFDSSHDDSDVSTVSVLCEVGERLASAIMCNEYFDSHKQREKRFLI